MASEYLDLAKSLYPQEEQEQEQEWSYFSEYNYDPIINSFGEVVLRKTIGEYQGDTYAIVKKGDLLGYLAIGWGSCSGCDALQACSSHDDVARLIGHIASNVRWGSAADLLHYFTTHDWEGDYIYHDEEFKEWKDEVVKWLEKEVAHEH